MGNGEAATPGPKKPPPHSPSPTAKPSMPPWRARRSVLVPAADGACSRRARRRAAARALPRAATRGWSRFLKPVRAAFPARHLSVVAGSFDDGSLTRTFGCWPVASAAQPASPCGGRAARVTASPCVNGVNVNRPARTTSSSELATWAAVLAGTRASSVRPTAAWSVLVTVRSSFASRFTSADGHHERFVPRHGRDSLASDRRYGRLHRTMRRRRGNRLTRRVCRLRGTCSRLHFLPRMSRFVHRPRIPSQEVTK